MYPNSADTTKHTHERNIYFTANEASEKKMSFLLCLYKDKWIDPHTEQKIGDDLNVKS